MPPTCGRRCALPKATNWSVQRHRRSHRPQAQGTRLHHRPAHQPAGGIAPHERDRRLIPMPAPGEIAAIILAGGQGVRLGGGDKPLRTIAGRPMLDHVLERLKGQAIEIAISANGDPQRLAGYGLHVIPDEAAGAGPLGGILSGMRWAKSLGVGRVLTVAGDTPFLPVDLARRSRRSGRQPHRRRVIGRTPASGLRPVACRAGARSRQLPIQQRDLERHGFP